MKLRRRQPTGRNKLFNKIGGVKNTDVTSFRRAPEQNVAKNKKRIPEKDILDLICIYFDCDVDDVLEFVPTVEVNHNELSAKPWDGITDFQRLFNPEQKQDVYLYW